MKKTLLLIGAVIFALLAAAGAGYIYTQGGNASGGIAFLPFVGAALCFYNWYTFDMPKTSAEDKTKYDRFGRRK